MRGLIRDRGAHTVVAHVSERGNHSLGLHEHRLSIRLVLGWTRLLPPRSPFVRRLPPASGVRQGIIIVATLVDKLPNLAGLARTCEVRDLGEGVQLEGACLWEGGPCPISAWKPQDSLYLLTVSDHESFDCLAPQVFRASLLVVPDLRVASDPAFSAISVTAEQWVPMAEVTEGALLPWLERKQAQG